MRAASMATLVVAMLWFPRPAAAQLATTPAGPTPDHVITTATVRAGPPLWALDLAIGGRSGRGGLYINPGGVVGDVTLARQVAGTWSRALVVAASGSIQGSISRPDECLLVTPDGPCAPDYPSFLTGALMGGGVVQSERLPMLRVLAGPAIYHGIDSETGMGLRLHGDVALQLTGLLSVTGGARMTWLRDFRDDDLEIRAILLGARITI